MLLVLGLAIGVFLLAGLRAARPGSLAGHGYPAPDDATQEILALARAHPTLARCEEIGRSREGRPIHALRLRAGSTTDRPRLLVSAQIHAIEYIGSFVARALARRLLEGFGSDPEATRLLERAEVVIVALSNPDGAWRIWQRGGFARLGSARFTAAGVDPNRNFPPVPGEAAGGRRAWNSARARPGSAYYCGPHPLSEPECLALARLAARERFCAALNFHSFGCVVYMPSASGTASHVLGAFDGPFQSRQRRRYKPIRERGSAISGQLDPYLLAAFGTPSVTVEVSRPALSALLPGRLGNLFWIANPADPTIWADNDVPASIHALLELLERSGGTPVAATHPELGPDPSPVA